MFTPATVSNLAITETLTDHEKRIFWRSTLGALSQLRAGKSPDDLTEHCRQAVTHFKAMAFAAEAFRDGQSLDAIQQTAIAHLDTLKETTNETDARSTPLARERFSKTNERP